MKEGIVDFAWQVIYMQNTIKKQEQRIASLEAEVAEYKTRLGESEEHGLIMMDNVMKLCMTPGVADALASSATKEG